MQCQSSPFGLTKDGQKTTLYTLSNEKGHNVKILNYGGIIKEINVPDASGQINNVVLGFDSIEAYEDYSPHFGCITGRVAGRISQASFNLNDTNYTLEKNNGTHCLHGGNLGLDKQIWSVTEIVSATQVELVLSHLSYDMAQGFPGNLDVVVTYIFDEESNLTIKYKATTDKDTILTLTNHSYFNLSGNPSTTILDHLLVLPSKKYVAVNSEIIPIGVLPTDSGPFDFTQATAIGLNISENDIQLKNAGGYDHAFILDPDAHQSIVLKDPKTGRILEINTTEACVVCYTGNFLTSDLPIQGSQSTLKYGAVCLETQYYPDAINQDFFPTKILRANEIYRQKTIYSFKA
ncbi:aldose epimerase family protein [Petrocella sp. FN5]|uniref:aldose epimerase family protein n=1 Tax=Petrocella sp. FN5 TaxID=3032002 RepID=UPI0023DCC422|nr:aldose epimerase family protein [Petrocella sp. FN5]MDF1617338.1 galactose mutarotase [Petrocella sp. FN5]